MVRLEAWIRSAHVSDCTPGAKGEKGEEVNCETRGLASNDLHIPLLDPSGDRTQDECTSVTAEMSPHFRPAAWSDLDLKTPVKNVVRVTGPLFYDNAHKPCLMPFDHTSADNKGRAPFRSTLWEIHPVYKLEVCANSDATKCDVTSDDQTMWIAYDQWVSDPANAGAIAATGEEQRNKCVAGPPEPGFVQNQCVSDAGGNSSPSTKKKKVN